MVIPLQYPMFPSPPCLHPLRLNLLVTKNSFSPAPSLCSGFGYGCLRWSSFHQLGHRDPRGSPLAASLAVLAASANGVVPAYRKKNVTIRNIPFASTGNPRKETADSLQWMWQQESLSSRLHMHWSTSWRVKGSHVFSALSREAGQSEALEIRPQEDSPPADDVESSSGSAIEELSLMGETSNHEKLNIRQHHEGKTGFVTFLREDIQPLEQITLNMSSPTKRWLDRLLWLVGPTVIVSSVVLPPVYLRKIFELSLADSLVRDFLILFFTEGLFYAGVAIFLVIAHNIRQFRGFRWGTEGDFDLSYKVSSIITMTIGVLLLL